MAKASRYAVLPAEASARLVGRSVLRSLAGEVVDEAEDALRGDDVDATHDMRVAVRRLRSAVETFGRFCGNGEFTRFAKAARRLGRRLGAVRDADVQLEALRSRLASATTAEAPGMAFVIESLEDRRLADLQRVGPAFEDFRRLKESM